MKKGLYINISIINHLGLLCILWRIDEYFIDSLLLLLLLYITIKLSPIFILRENNIGKKRRLLLYIFIVINYLALLGLTLGMEYTYLLMFIALYLFIALYIIMMALYFSSLFKEDTNSIK